MRDRPGIASSATPHGELDPDRLLQAPFIAQALRRPGHAAVVAPGRALTYQELYRWANQLGRRLRALGARSNTAVAVVMEKGWEQVVAALGILQAGAAYLPIDPSFPTERLSYLLAHGEATLVITQPWLVHSLEWPAGVTLLCPDDVAGDDGQPLQPIQGPADLAYIIYTSGSTGLPKGVAIDHRGALNTIRDINARFGVGPADRVLALSSLNFDLSVYDIFGVLGAGGTVVFPAAASQRDPAHWAELIAQQQITLWNSVPALMQLLVDYIGDGRRARLGSLRLVLLSGDWIPIGLPDRIKALIDHVQVISLGGATEASIWSCLYAIEQVDPAWNSIPYGFALSGQTLHVLDQALQPCAIGQVGQIYIGGIGLATGYWRDPERTAERFIPNPLGDFGFWILDFGLGEIQSPKSKIQNGERLYRTGDLGRYMPGGNVEFLGREDFQVKVQGYRIELGEIEAALALHPAVRAAVVSAVGERHGNKRLVAYVVRGPWSVVRGPWSQIDDGPHSTEQRTTDNGQLTTALRAFLKTKLPEYMVPAFFVMLEALPLTANGKLDRRALPAPDLSQDELDQSYVAPRTPVEQELARLWASILGVDRVGIHDNFFALGGHSLAATQVMTRVRERLGAALPLRTIFEASTVAELALALEADGGRSRDAQAVTIAPMPRGDAIPLSFSQERVWFLQQLEPENRAYAFQATLRLAGTLDVAALERSLKVIVGRHEIFRTTFPAIGGRPVQIIHADWSPDLPLVDLEHHPEDEREDVAQRLISAEFHKPYDLTQLPLIRWTLLRLSEHEHVLIHAEHHLIHDGWSFNVFLRELTELYQAFSAGGRGAVTAPLPPLPIQFADFAIWQRQWMRGEIAEAQLAYWKKKLAGDLPVLELPTDRPRPPVQTYRGAVLRLDLASDLCEAIRTFSRGAGITPFMTMLAAFLTLLHRYTDQTDICVGSGIANRRWRETESMIGMVINTLVLRADLAGEPSFHELLRRVREVTLEAYANQDLPLGHVVEALQPERSLSYSPLYQALFSFHDSPLAALDLPGLTATLAEGLSNGSAKFDMNVIVIPRSEQHIGQRREAAEGITVLWEYNTDLFDAGTIERMVGHYQALLARLIADPDQPITRVPLLTAEEYEQVVVTWNRTATAYPADQSVAALFEAQAEQTPDAIALVGGVEALTYRELNRRANQLAHYLRDRGVRPEVPVGIYMRRSTELVVGLLGILKAGGAYVPLDPSYPQERLAFMLQDTQALLMLTASAGDKETPRGHPETGDKETVETENLPFSPSVVDLIADWPDIARGSDLNPVSLARADSLAYIVYTSGSTGQPKGVCVEHRGIVRLVKGTTYASLGPDEVILQVAPITFDAATFEIWGSLLNGARLVLAPPELLSLAQLGRTIEQSEITTLWLTAGLFHQMVDEQLGSLAQVRQVLAGGDVLSPSHVRKLLAAPGLRRLINGYGPTESTTFACCYPMTDPAQGDGPVPIGRPIANTQVYVLDRRMQPVPIGVWGELYIGGDGLARGYLNQPELTTDRFIPSPFTDQRPTTDDRRPTTDDPGNLSSIVHRPSTRLYRTGDIVRYRPDGNLEFLGRRDQQVKIRGFRIELGEIEAVLSQHPAVREALVLAREDRPGDKRLVGYVVPTTDDRPFDPAQDERPTTEDQSLSSIVYRPSSLVSELRSFLKDRLPDYMVPSALVVLEALPLTPNGKVDRRALPPPDQHGNPADGAFVAPRTPIEQGLAEIWAAVLGRARVGVYDNFFALGGHSLLATQVISRVRDAFQIDLPLAALFEAPTIEALADAIIQHELEQTDGDLLERLLATL